MDQLVVERKQHARPASTSNGHQRIEPSSRVGLCCISKVAIVGVFTRSEPAEFLGELAVPFLRNLVAIRTWSPSPRAEHPSAIARELTASGAQARVKVA